MELGEVWCLYFMGGNEEVDVGKDWWEVDDEYIGGGG